jgi:hypothetical protein
MAASALAGTAWAAVKRTEVVKSTTPADDAKGLDANVPACVSVSSQFERVVVLRMKHQTDLLAALEEQVRSQGIRNAIILSGIGSVLSTHYHVVSNRTFPSKNVFLEDSEKGADVVNVSGCVMNGKIHCHVTFSDEGKCFGGHLEPGTRVFTFAVITLGVLPTKANLARFDDKTWR